MKITIAEYLLKRLKEVNVDHMFGVPGDYNLGFLDYVEDSKDIEWVGSCNELNAGYAADGYARLRGFGVILTTYGVGSLSAINATTGSFTENVPVLHISGVPSASVQQNRKLVHHSTARGEFDTFDRMFREVTEFQSIITEYNAAEEIDRVIESICKYQLPGYIELPVDIVSKEIEIDEMKPLNLTMRSNEKTLQKFISDVKEMIANSKGQHILADYEVMRAKVEKELEAFINEAKIPVNTLSIGKTAVQESNPYFAGLFSGETSSDLVKRLSEASDIVLLFGVKFVDTTTAGFRYINKNVTMIEVGLTECKIGETIYTGLYIKDVIKALTDAKIKFHNDVKVEREAREEFVPTDAKLTQDRYFAQMEAFLKPNDVLIGETGTSYSGAAGMRFPEGASFVGQGSWMSIGYATPAALGTQLADTSRRNILLTGDGSLQLTVQEVSTMIRQKLNTVLFIVNNDGYTIERLIHGPEREYNHIQMWKYTEVIKAFATERDIQPTCFKVTTEKELADAMEAINKGTQGIAVVEVIMGKMDAPKSLRADADLFSKQNSY
ncbi:MAG: thiamine pyrophosphate-binding protein [Clostridium perfringens]|nr:thiamine pyrophosphate-binding protein [Clostridium perfringens]